MNAHTQLASFNGYPIELIYLDDTPYMTAETIGKALGLKNPSNSINKAYQRHADEFIGNMTRVGQSVPTFGGKQNVRLFSLDGARMLAFFVQTDTAKAFRQWVLSVLNERQQHFNNIAELQSELLKARPDWAEMLRYRALGLSAGEIARLVGAGRSTVSRHLRYLRSLGFAVQIAPQPRQLAAARARLAQKEEAQAQLALGLDAEVSHE